MENATGFNSAALVERVKGIILKPAEEWPKIAAEPHGIPDILKGYVLPLAAIAPVAAFLGGQIFGYGAFGFSYRPSLAGSLGTAVVSFALTIVGLFVLAFIADFLAPKFDGVSNRLQAFKLVAYGATAAWVAGLFGLIPALGFFAILGLYSIYLFYTGATPLLHVPEEKRAGFTAVTFLCAIVLNLLVGALAGLLLGIVGLGAGAVSSITRTDTGDDVTINIPGVGAIDTAKVNEAAERAEKIQKGEIKPVPAETLKAMLPAGIGAFQRTGFSTQALGQAGAGAEGTYKGPADSAGGNYSFDLRVQDMLALSGLAGIGAAMGIEQTRENENGYERMGTVDGQWREEKWDKSSSDGTYAIMVANRFRVEASGRVPNIDVLKNAVGSVDAGKLDDLAGD